MSRKEVTAEKRRQLVMLCLRADLRTNWPHYDAAHKWYPGTVKHPSTLSWYNDKGAWEFIAECISAGVPIKYKPWSAQKPDEAWELIAAPAGSDREIYMKIAINEKCDKLIGVSFHYARPAR